MIRRGSLARRPMKPKPRRDASAPRSRELQFLKAKLVQAGADGDMIYAADIQFRIERLQENVSLFHRGLRGEPW